jgi:hypothetical protein
MAKTGGVVEAFPSGATKVTRTVAAAITAGRLVEVAGVGTVQHAAAASLKVLGVALEGSDGVGAGTGAADKIAVATGGVFYLTASGAVTAGDQLIAAANGQVSTLAAAAGATAADINNARAVIGTALDTIANGQTGRVLVNRTSG